MRHIVRTLAGAALSALLAATVAGCANDPDALDGAGVAAKETSEPDSRQTTGSEPSPEGQPTEGRPTDAEPTGPRPTGALGAQDAAASCVESYTPEAVGARSFAFDGTVLEIGPPVSDRGGEADLPLAGVTFEVNEWFSGGEGATVTVDMDVPAEGVITSAGGQPIEEGWRLLVSGEPRWGGEPLDAPIAWTCGFSRYYDAQTAAAWRDAVPG